MFRVFTFGFPRNSRFFIASVLAIFQAISAIALLACSAWLLSRASEQPPLMYLSIAIVGVRTFALAKAVLRYGERWLSHDAALKSLGTLRVELFQKLIPLAPAGFGRLKMGDVGSRVTADVEEILNLPLRVILPTLQSAAASFVSIMFFALLLPNAALLITILLTVSLLIAIPISNQFSARFDRENAHIRGQLADKSLELIENSEIFTQYGWLDKELGNFQVLEKRLGQRGLFQATSSGVSMGVFSLSATIGALGVLFLGVQAIGSGQFEQVLLAVVALLPLGVFEIAGISHSAVSTWRKYKSSAQRLIEIQDSPIPHDLSVEFGSSELQKFDNISLRDVSAGYPGKAAAIMGISLTISRGETVALIGPSGSGKSTVALLLAGLLNPRSGHVEVNGLPVANFSADSFRKCVGYLEQQTPIFAGTVRDNLRLANEVADDASLINVLRRVNLWKMFDSRLGLDTELGENGVLISGGEAQRLSMARALLADFEFLVLDEPTSSVDSAQAVRLMQELFESADSSKTILLITHDSRIAKLADRIISI